MNQHRSNFKSNEVLPHHPSSDNGGSGGGGGQKHSNQQQPFKKFPSSQPSSLSSSLGIKPSSMMMKTYTSSHHHHPILDNENINSPSRDIGNKPPQLPPTTNNMDLQSKMILLPPKNQKDTTSDPLHPINNNQPLIKQSNNPSSDKRKMFPTSVVTTTTDGTATTATLLDEEKEGDIEQKQGKSYGNMIRENENYWKNLPPSQPKRCNSITGGGQENDDDDNDNEDDNDSIISNNKKKKNVRRMTDHHQLYGQPSQRSLLSTASGDDEDLSMMGGDLSESCLSSYADDDYTESSSIAGSSIADFSRASTSIQSGVIAIGVIADSGSSVASSSATTTTTTNSSMIADGTFNHDDGNGAIQQRNNKVSLLQHSPPPLSSKRGEEAVDDKKKDDDILSEIVAKDLAQREHDLKMKLSGKASNNGAGGEKQVPRLLPRRERLLVRTASRTNVNIESQGRPSFLLESLKREASTRILEEPEEYIVGGGGGAEPATTTTTSGIPPPPPPPARHLQRGLSSSSFASSVASSDGGSNTGGTPRLHERRKRCDSASTTGSGGGGGLSTIDRQAKVRAAMGAMGSSTRRLSRSTSYRLSGRGSRGSPSPSPTLASTTRKQPPPIVDHIGDDNEEEEEEYSTADNPSKKRPSLQSFRPPSLRSTDSGLTLDENMRNEIITASSSHHQRRRASSSSNSGMRDADIEAKIRASSMSSKNSSTTRRQSSLEMIEGRAAAAAAPARLARRTTSSTFSTPGGERPSDDKRNLRITPPAAAARRTSSFEAAASGTASVASSSTAAASRPSDEKAAYRRGVTGDIASSLRHQEQQRPGAHAISNQNVPRNSKTEVGRSGGDAGLSLASGDSRQPLESENPEPLDPVTTSDVSSPMNDNTNSNSEDADIEAQAGVPVLLPGAFAVTSLDQVDDGGYDSGFEDSTVENESAQVSGAATAATTSGDGEQGDDDDNPPMLRPDVPDAPLQAELYERHVVDGLVLTVNDEEDEDNAKLRQRIPTFFKSFLALVLAIIGITIFLVVSKTGSDGEDIAGVVGQDDLPPELEGWSQLGEVLMGPTNADNAKFGFSLSMSGDGNRLAIGLPGANGADGSSTEELRGSGSVQIYDLNGTEWIKVHEITGPGAHAAAGKAVTLSYDGSRVAFSAPEWTEVGFIAVYEEFQGNWSVVGEVPIVNPEKERWDLDLSNNGTILAISNKDANSDDGKKESVGKVRVFQESNKTWDLLGDEIEGDSAGSFLGWSLSLSGNGHRVAVSALGSNEFTGDVRVFDFDGESWERLGSTLEGDSSRENFGSAVAISNDGMTVAVGSPGYATDDGNGIGAGRVSLFSLNEEEAEESSREWIGLGDPLEGSASFDSFGTSVAVSADGRVVAVGGPENDTFGDNSGHIQLFEYDDGKWIQLGSDIGTPTTEGGKFGFSIAISADGSKFAGAAPESIFDGRVNDVGEVWVFNTTDSEEPMGDE